MADSEVIEKPEDDSIRNSIIAAVESSKPVETVQAEQVIPAAETKPVKETKAAKEVKPSAPVQSDPATPEVKESAPEAGAEPAAETAAEVDPAAPKTDEGPIPANWGRWSKADKERFLEQPEGARKIIIDRIQAMEADYTKKTMRVAELENDFAPVAEMFAPFKLQLKQSGRTPYSIIQNWAAAEQALANPNTRETAFKNIAQAYQVDLPKLFGGQPQASVQPAIDPSNMTEQQQLDALLQPYMQQAVGPLQKELETVRAQLAQAQQFQHGSVQVQRQQAVQSVQNEAQSFASATDAQGNLAHPYFADVENDMAAIMAGHFQYGRSLTLDEAYQQAVRANPSTYERLTAQQVKAADEKRSQEARAKAAQANRAGSSVSGSPGMGQPFAHTNGNGQDLSLRDSLMASYQAATGAV